MLLEAHAPSTVALQRYRLIVEYDGGEFFGWQWQPEKRTVQAVIEASLRQLFGITIRVFAAGRTDTGVHALGQVIHFDAPPKFAPQTLLRGLNGTLPPDVRVGSVNLAASDFHARYGARWRWYRYRLFRRTRALERDYGWHSKYTLKLELLQQAAELLVGEHDFSAFAGADDELLEAVAEHGRSCLIYAAGWETLDGEWRFHIVGNRFLRHMVRYLMGAMIDVAKERFSLDEFQEMLSSPARRDGTFCVPGRGLCLMRVGYGSYPFAEPASNLEQAYPFVNS